MSDIETGVDRLVELIKQKHKVGVNEAAKLLGVSSTLIQEWASFLEEEKVIDIDYHLTNTILIERQVSEEDLGQKKIEFRNLKEMFVRKVETFFQSIDNETQGIDSLKIEFDKLKKNLSAEVSKVKDELKELETYESLKQDIDTQILEQQAAYKKQLEEAHNRLITEQTKYDDIIRTINLEKESVTTELKEINSLESQEEKLKQKVVEINKIVKDIDNNITVENNKVTQTKQNIKSLESYANQLVKDVDQKKKLLNPLLEESKKQEKKIMDLQNNLIDKVSKKKDFISAVANEGEKVLGNFNTFFDKRKEIDGLFEKIEKDRADLKEELSGLIKKAKILEISADANTVTKQTEDLKNQMKQVDVKKNLFKDEVNRLKTLIKTK